MVIRSAQERVFCAGANIRMLAQATHPLQGELLQVHQRDPATRSRKPCRERATLPRGGERDRGGRRLRAGPGLRRDPAGRRQSSAVSFPGDAALGGAARHRRAHPAGRQAQGPPRPRRRVLTLAEGIEADARWSGGWWTKSCPSRGWDAAVASAPSPSRRTSRSAATRPAASCSSRSPRSFGDDRVRYGFVDLEIDRAGRLAHLRVRGPTQPRPGRPRRSSPPATASWPLAPGARARRRLLHLRFNEPELGRSCCTRAATPTWCSPTTPASTRPPATGSPASPPPLATRVLKRLDLTARTLSPLIEPGSCFAGTLAELALAADRSVHARRNAGRRPAPRPSWSSAAANFGTYPMSNGLSRLETRFLGEPESLGRARARRRGSARRRKGRRARARRPSSSTTSIGPTRSGITLEERASFSPDALTGMEANLRFPGPETMETKIFGRLSAWQNWIFQRPNAAGDDGALKRYGTRRAADLRPEAGVIR